MTPDSRKLNAPPDDIDLLLLIERIIVFFSRYKWLFIIAIILGLSFGIFAYRSLPNIYTSRMVLHSYILTNQEHIQVIENWNQLLKRKEYAVLAGALNCPENTFYPLKKLKAEEIQKVFTGVNPHGFFIEVNVTDNAILDQLQNGITYGLENNDYVKNRIAVKRANLEMLIAETGTEIQKLDSTKRIIENIIAGKASTSSSLILDGAGTNKQLIEMNEKHLAYKEELRFCNAVQVLQGFSKFRKPTDPKLVSWLIIGLLVFLSLAFLLSLFLSIKEKMKRRSGAIKGPDLKSTV
jgi:hypothetical protein